MTALYISEFENAGTIFSTSPTAPPVPALVEQNVALSGSSAQSSAFSAITRLVLIATDTACCLAFGTNPTATATYHRLGANEARFYVVNPGDKVAGITTT